MTQQAVTTKKGFRLFTYIGEIVNELKKVVWLSRREVVYLTGLVLLVTIIAGVILGALDFGFSALVDKLFIR
ncbi:MAG: preprotein translocase subunit SecE [Dehalococcoidales bacterium]|jgi:preprotein translocase subunit SecE